MIKNFFNIPVFSAIGNHESFPVNQYLGPNYDDWLYEPIAADWAHWLPDDAINTLKFGGYYTARIRPGLRVISLNTNLYADGNFWLFMNYSDYGNQLPWVQDVLHQARSIGEKIIMIGHSDRRGWENPFGLPFLKMMSDYRDIIIGYYFGHNHVSEEYLSCDNETGRIPISVSFISGSVTPLSLNPGYRLYYYDRTYSSPYFISDFDQYWVDLPTANQFPHQIPDWSTLRFTASSYFNMTQPGDPMQWLTFANRMLNDSDAFQAYQYAFFRGAMSYPGNKLDPKTAYCSLTGMC